MKNYNILWILLLLGLLFIITNQNIYDVEPFSMDQCPNTLIQKGKHIFLYNSKLATIPGVNPVKFNNLDEYVEYTHWQRSQKLNCPILSLQHSQSNSKYNFNPPSANLLSGLTPIDSVLAPVSKLLDATRNDPPYNKNSYPGFDPQNQYIGLQTPLDKLQHQNINGTSPSPMDTNWGGGSFTQSLVDKGYYKDDVVKIKVA